MTVSYALCPLMPNIIHVLLKALHDTATLSAGDETLKDAGELLVFVHPVESTASEATGHQFEVHVVHENKGTLAVDKVVVC